MGDGIHPTTYMSETVPHIFMEEWLFFMHKLCGHAGLAANTGQPPCAWFICLRLWIPLNPSILPEDSKMRMSALKVIKLLFFKLRFLVISFSFPYFAYFIQFMSVVYFSVTITQENLDLLWLFPMIRRRKYNFWICNFPAYNVFLLLLLFWVLHNKTSVLAPPPSWSL